MLGRRMHGQASGIDTSGAGALDAPSVLVAIVLVGWILLAWTAAWQAFEPLNSLAPALGTPGGAFAYWVSLKVVVWAVPAVLIMRRWRCETHAVLGFHAPLRTLLWGIGIGGALAATNFLVNGEIAPASAGWALLNAALVAPIVEEVVIRGVAQPATTRQFGAVGGITVSSILFVLVHCPGWFFQGRLIDMLTAPVGGALTIFVLGLVFGVTAHRSGSIAAPIIAHAINNFTA